MIISCPECAGPFEVPDDQIAALVQVECPHCSFRMILDFAAANDPGLVEDGMRMASGFRTAADFRTSQHAASGPARPAAEPVPEPAVAEVAAEAAPVPEPVRPEPVVAAEPVAPRPPAATPAPEPARPVSVPAEAAPPPREPTRPAADAIPPVRARIETDEDLQVRVPKPAEEVAVRAPEPAVDEDALTMAPPGRGIPPVRMPPVSAEPSERTERPSTSSSDGGTVVTPRPSADDDAAHPPFDADEEAKTVMVPPEAREAARLEMERAEQGEQVAARRAEPEPEADDLEVEVEDEPPSDRLPPHTPPDRTASSKTDKDKTESEPKPKSKPETKPKRPRFEALDDLEQDAPARGMSTLGVAVVVILLLLSLGLVGASMALEDTVDPRPLLEKLYRQNIKGE